MTDSLRVTGGVRVPQFRGSPIADRELWIVVPGSTGHGSLVTGHGSLVTGQVESCINNK